MKRTNLLTAVIFIILLSPVTLFAQKRESLALFPFTGGNVSDGTAIVSSLARQRTLRDSFNKVTLVTQNTIATMNFEQRFQRNSGLTDADTIFELGKALNAQYVIAGYITKFGNRNLVLISIMDVESLQQIAGDYRTYGTIEEIDTLIPDIAQKLSIAIKRDTSKLPGLSVPSFNIDTAVSNKTDAMVLAQILACDLANSGKYAVLPRTDSLDSVLEEHKRQRSGITDQERVKKLGAGRNAQFVLSGYVQKLGTINKFAVDILNIADGSLIDGHEETYTSLSQGYEKMSVLATRLTNASGSQIPDNFVFVQGGPYIMGSPASEYGRMEYEGPQHQVTVSSFYMSKFEVTQKEYQDVMGKVNFNKTGEYLPVMCNWNDAIEYCNKRSIKEGLTPCYRGSGDNITCDWNVNGYRLPTEAEWEYAAKGGNKDYIIYLYSGSNNPGAVAWYAIHFKGDDCYVTGWPSGERPVGQKAPNSLGIYDMSGNVSEWCWDWYGAYTNKAQTNPHGPDFGEERINRGGGYGNSSRGIRSSRRGFDPPFSWVHHGFRVVRR